MGLSVLFFVCLKKLTTTQTSDHKRRVIAKLAICKNNGFFMKWEKVMESNSLEKEPGVQEVLEELKCSAIFWWNGLDIGTQRYCAYSYKLR